MASLFAGSLFIAVSCVSLSYGAGTCDDPYHVEKYTVVSSDSERDYTWAYQIFPYLEDQDASKFVDGLCGKQMKVELPDSCFKLHAPQTWEHDSGLLEVDILERKMSKKWNHVLSSEAGTWNYDSFLDFSMAFWVQSLDVYLEQWQSLNAQADGDVLEFVGIEWEYKFDIDLEIDSTDYQNGQFYSVLIHSPESNINYEFISYTKPSSPFYEGTKWIGSSLPRVTFKAQNDPFPWNREDQSPIVPVRVSRATTDLDKMIDFYDDVMESEMLYDSEGAITDDLGGDDIATKTVFVTALDTQIELQFVERPSYYTAGDFKLMQYERLLLETHAEVISTPYCGIDRWFDNHYGFTTWTVDGYMDRILEKLKDRKMKYRVYQTPYEHSSTSGKANLDLYGKDRVFIFFVMEPSGQTIQIMGDFPDHRELDSVVPNWSVQWCYKACANGVADGTVNANHVYVDSENYDSETDEYNDRALAQKNEERQLHLFGMGSEGEEHHEKYLLGTMTGLTFGLAMCAGYYFWKKYRKKKFIENLLKGYNKDNGDKTPLINNL